MKYIKLFDQHTDYVNFLSTDEYITPNVSFCVLENEAHFNDLEIDYTNSYFTIEALQNGNVYFHYPANASTQVQRYIEYSKDNGETWARTTNVNNQECIMTIPLLTGETALVRGDNDNFWAFGEGYEYCYFYSNIEFNVSGNVMSLLFVDNFVNETTCTERMFSGLFGGYDYGSGVNCNVVDASHLVLPTGLYTECYRGMFYECTSLTSAPELPATTLADYCYYDMFSGCTSLTTIPAVLPATTLATYCYSSMFSGCTSLTTAPELNATTLEEGCYQNMFYNCSNLNHIKALFTTTPSYTYTGEWVYGVAATGTFVKSRDAVWNVTGTSGVPSGWDVDLYGD